MLSRKLAERIAERILDVAVVLDTIAHGVKLPPVETRSPAYA
jgi:hypothetical protein